MRMNDDIDSMMKALIIFGLAVLGISLLMLAAMSIPEIITAWAKVI